MTISESSIKILASERMTDTIDGGGFQTSVVVVDGVENNIFLDVSSLDRAEGRFNLRKIYAAVQTATQDTYLGSHVIVDEAPADTAVSSFMFRTGDLSTLRAAAASYVQGAPWAQQSSFVVYGSGGFGTAGSIGDSDIFVHVSSGTTYFQVGQLFWMQGEGFKVITAIVSGGNPNDGVITIDPPLAAALPMGGKTFTKIVRDAVNAPRLYGVTGMVGTATLGDKTIKVQNVMVQVLPMDVNGYIPSVDPTYLGIDPHNYWIDGTGAIPDPVPQVGGYAQMILPGDMVVIHHTKFEDPQTVTAAQDIDLGRTRLADVRVYGNDGVRITTGFTVNKATGHIVFSSVSGYSQPVTIRHRIEDMLRVDKLDYLNNLTFSKALSHNFPSGTKVSNAMILGDLQAVAHTGFQLATWASVFSDSPTGSAISADYNEPANPIVVTNAGAIKERWALVFTNTTQGKIIGEQVGEIGTFNTGTTTAPINPASGVPYFSIPAAGWGTGWAIGNTYRFNTDSANQPIWMARSIKPSDPFVGQDKVTIAVRGDIDA